jgi:hypothetical protein
MPDLIALAGRIWSPPEDTGVINRSDPWRHTTPLMILGHLQNAVRC